MWVKYNWVYGFSFSLEGKSRKVEVGGVRGVSVCLYLCVFPITQAIAFSPRDAKSINSDFLIHLKLLYLL